MSSARNSGTFAPKASASPTVASSPSALRSVRYSSAPSAASFNAGARPIPLAAPVRKHRLPLNDCHSPRCAMAVTIPAVLLGATPQRGQPQSLDDLHGSTGILAAADECAVAG